MTDFRSIGVIGAGQMGSGIAQVFASAGFQVFLNDIEPARIDGAIKLIEQKLAHALAHNKITVETAKEAMTRIHPAIDFEALSDCDLVIETAVEDLGVKKQILSELSKTLKPEAVMASNTSSMSITGLASSTDRPERFIGIHFMNPAPAMELVEIIRGISTSKETYERARALVDQLGKTISVSEDFPAFIVNRILMPMINEAIYTLYEGVGTVEAIDTGMTLGAKHPLGPLALADFIGLDTCLAIMQVLYEGLADSKYRPCPLLVKYVEAGWLGRKTGRGFYDYSGPEPLPTR